MNDNNKQNEDKTKQYYDNSSDEFSFIYMVVYRCTYYKLEWIHVEKQTQWPWPYFKKIVFDYHHYCHFIIVSGIRLKLI